MMVNEIAAFEMKQWFLCISIQKKNIYTLFPKCLFLWEEKKLLDCIVNIVKGWTKNFCIFWWIYVHVSHCQVQCRSNRSMFFHINTVHWNAFHKSYRLVLFNSSCIIKCRCFLFCQRQLSVQSAFITFCKSVQRIVKINY